MKHWNELKWWNSKECASTHEKLKWHDYGKGQSWLPKREQVYRALHETHFSDVQVVIVGQDPYHTPGLANGLAFSVDAAVSRNKYPPTLVNIYKELVSDLHIPYPKSGDLSPWARQGVLLWNTSLTVEPYRANSHQGMWDALTDEVVRSVDEHLRGVVFVLWGRHAQRFLPRVLPSVENKRHRVILSPHPSPLSAHRGFFGTRPFSTINTFVKNKIDWRL